MIKVSVPLTIAGLRTLLTAANRLEVFPESKHYTLVYEDAKVVLRVESEHFHAV